jgi:hypothetical protein
MIRLIALGIAAIAFLPAVASAAPNCSAIGAEQACTCAAELIAGSPIAELTEIAGDVKKTADGAYTPTGATTTMSAGDGVLIGDGKATLTAGPNCQLKPLSAQTSVTAGAVEGCGCVWISENKPVPPPPDGGAGALLVVGGGAAAAAIIVGAQKKDSGPLSP